MEEQNKWEPGSRVRVVRPVWDGDVDLLGKTGTVESFYPAEDPPEGSRFTGEATVFVLLDYYRGKILSFRPKEIERETETSEA